MTMEIDALYAGLPMGQLDPCENCARLAAEVEALRNALDQLLDDMGKDGHCVCEAAKQQAIAVLAARPEGEKG